MSYNEFLVKALKTYTESKGNYRIGQAIITTLQEAKPELYNDIVGGKFDCYYDNEIVTDTLNWLEKNW